MNWQLKNLLNSDQIFALINVANIKSKLLDDKLVISPENFLGFSDRFKGIPILIPADKNLFHFDHEDVFTIDHKELLKLVYDISDEKYVGFKHAFRANAFLSNFRVRENYKSFVGDIVKQNLEVIAYVTNLKKRFQNIGAFQTRNIPHLGHEKILQSMLKKCDHVVVNPVIGPKKKGDVTIQCLTEVYHYLIETKYKERISFSPIFANMYYAGPREAVHHALMRQKIGFNLFSVGRDHAGAQSVYMPLAAANYMRSVSEKLNIDILRHNGAAFCKKCREVVLIGECDHQESNMLDISGTDFRSSIRSKEIYDFADAKMQEFLINSKMDIFE